MAKTLKSFLAEITTHPTITVGAPELGDGVTVFARHLTVADRIQIDEIRKSTDLESAAKLKEYLVICAVNENGTDAFDGPGDPAIDELPAVLAERIVTVAIDASTAGGDAKK